MGREKMGDDREKMGPRRDFSNSAVEKSRFFYQSTDKELIRGDKEMTSSVGSHLGQGFERCIDCLN